MTLAQYYMMQANQWAFDADFMRIISMKHMVRVCQDLCAVYVALAQEAAARYGDAR